MADDTESYEHCFFVLQPIIIKDDSSSDSSSEEEEDERGAAGPSNKRNHHCSSRATSAEDVVVGERQQETEEEKARQLRPDLPCTLAELRDYKASLEAIDTRLKGEAFGRIFALGKIAEEIRKMASLFELDDTSITFDKRMKEIEKFGRLRRYGNKLEKDIDLMYAKALIIKDIELPWVENQIKNYKFE